MELTRHNHGPVEVIELPARLVMANAPDTRRAILDLIEQGRNRLIFDLNQVDFIDSSGLSVLVSALKAANKDAGEVLLLSPSDGVRSLIELTRLHQIFEIYEDRNAAIQRLS
ncbi:MAG: STAS domain-containing protein [Candidatus Thiodiazotropha sp.]|jgi:anti-sigma B factor antagonist